MRTQTVDTRADIGIVVVDIRKRMRDKFRFVVGTLCFGGVVLYSMLLGADLVTYLTSDYLTWEHVRLGIIMKTAMLPWLKVIPKAFEE